MSDVTITPLENGNVRIHVPMRLKTNRGRRQIIMPEGADGAIPGADSPVQTALAQAVCRAHAWTKMIESGEMVPFTCGGIHAAFFLPVRSAFTPPKMTSCHFAPAELSQSSRPLG